MSAFSSWLGALLAPPRCISCDAPRRVDAAFCPACARAVLPAPPDGRGLALFAYGGPIADALSRFKYRGRVDCGSALARLMVHLAEEAERFRPDLVVPVPLHPARLAERGYNQSLLLAKPLARALGVPIFPRALVRARATAQQAGLGPASRRDNVRGVFRVRQAAPVRGRRVLLVDDVRTTGATLGACSESLREGGALAVCSAVLALAVATA